MPLVFTLATRNPFQDRLRFIASLTGIVFSVLLVMVQMGLYFGFSRVLTIVIDHASTDLFDETRLLPQIRKKARRARAWQEDVGHQAAMIAAAANPEATPLEFLLAVMRDPGVEPAMRVGGR